MKCCLYLRLLPALVLVCLAAEAEAEVVDSSNAGFTVTFEMTINAPADKVYENLVQQIGRWWHPDHTFSADAANLYLDAKEKGWFGERLPDGGVVQHMEVINAAPAKLLRLRGALGPLQEYALVGTMSWNLRPVKRKTELKLVYCVGGYRPGGVGPLATPVNNVMGMQATRLKNYCETGSPTKAAGSAARN
jgi:uncharacterized protein YndB with AHSA1/START domain